MIHKQNIVWIDCATPADVLRVFRVLVRLDPAGQGVGVIKPDLGWIADANQVMDFKPHGSASC